MTNMPETWKKTTGKSIMLTGGGTLGSVTPLLSVYEAWRKLDPEQTFLFVGTPRGPERKLIEETGLPFHPILVPKAYRYLTWRWLFSPILLVWSFLASAWLLAQFRPSWILSAGSYVSVPLALLAPLFRTRVAIHQLDYELGLANRLMAPVASLVTSTFPSTARQLPCKHVEVVGALAYGSHVLSVSRAEAIEHFDLDVGRPTILVLGGGIGSLVLNQAFERVADRLASEMNILHSTGAGKGIFKDRRAPETYKTVELFIDDFGMALDLADLVVTRAGVGTLLELVRKKKAAIFVPLPDSPQVANAKFVEEARAGVVLEEDHLDTDLLKTIHETLELHRKKQVEERIGGLFSSNGAEEIVRLIRQKNTPG